MSQSDTKKALAAQNWESNLALSAFAETFGDIVPASQRRSGVETVASKCLDVLRYVAAKRAKAERLPVTSLDPNAREGVGWKVGNANVFLTRDIRKWLEVFKSHAFDTEFTANAIQSAWRGYWVRRKFRPILQTWRHLRLGLSHAFRAQFASVCNEMIDDE